MTAALPPEDTERDQFKKENRKNARKTETHVKSAIKNIANRDLGSFLYQVWKTLPCFHGLQDAYVRALHSIAHSKLVLPNVPRGRDRGQPRWTAELLAYSDWAYLTRPLGDSRIARN